MYDGTVAGKLPTEMMGAPAAPPGSINRSAAIATQSRFMAIPFLVGVLRRLHTAIGRSARRRNRTLAAAGWM
jgi:hypothetical protein